MAEKQKKVTLKLEDVSKSFARVETDAVTHALGGVSMTMESGEFISLVGPSGCGKSTILRLVAGLIGPTTGRLTVNGQEIDGPSPDRGMVFQRPTLFPWLTVEKNIAFSLKMQDKLQGNEDKVVVYRNGHKSGVTTVTPPFDLLRLKKQFRNAVQQ